MPRSFEPDSNYAVDEVLKVSDPGSPVEISIENRNGEIRVFGSDRDDIWVRADKHGNRSSVTYQETRFRIESVNNVITIAPVYAEGGSGGPNVSVDLDLDLGEMMRGVFGGRTPGAGEFDPGDIERAARHAERTARQAEREVSRQERRTRRGRGFGIFWNSNDVHYEIELEVPRALEYRLRINTMSGEVEVGELTGALDLNTASGDMTVTHLTGDLRFNSASGNLSLTQALGQLTASSASGDLEVEGGAFNALTVNTVSGDVNLDAALTGTGPYTVESVSGDLNLALASLNPATGAERELDLTFRSMSGDASFGSDFKARGGRRWSAAGSEPGPTVAVKTVSGDLTANLGASSQATALGRRAQAVAAPAMDAASEARPSPAPVPAPVSPVTPPVTPPTPPLPPTPPAPVMPRDRAESISSYGEAGGGGGSTGGNGNGTATATRPDAARLALLEAVERGEIDIEEALRQLEERAEGDEPPA